MTQEELLGSVDATLYIELTTEPVLITQLPADRMPSRRRHSWARDRRPASGIKSMELDAHVYEDHDFRPLTDEELETVVIDEPSIVLLGLANLPVSHQAPDGHGFRLRDLLAAVLETELQTRAQTEWFGGIDIHHVYLEEISRRPDGVWETGWGS